MSSDPQLYKKLIDDDTDLESVDVEAIYPSKNKKDPVILRSSGGRLTCWCKCVLITLALTTIVFMVGSMSMYVIMKGVVQHLTVTTPHEKFPVVDMTEAELAVVQDRVVSFVDQLRAGQTPKEPLVVTQDEINGFLGHSDYLRGNMMVTIAENKIQEDYSLPVWMLPGGQDRYFVGEDHVSVDPAKHTLEVEMHTEAKHSDWFDGPLLLAQMSYVVQNHKDGSMMLELYLEHGTFFGQAVPEDFIAQRKNLLEDFCNDSSSSDSSSSSDDEDCKEVQAVVNGIERVAVEPGKITIYPRLGYNLSRARGLESSIH